MGSAVVYTAIARGLSADDGRLPVLLLFPLTICVLPALPIVFLGPPPLSVTGPERHPVSWPPPFGGVPLSYLSGRWSKRTVVPAGQGKETVMDIQRFFADDEGQGLVEYALIIAVIAIAVIVAMIFLRGQITNIFSNIGNNLT
ncbi:MAG: hypothetical protein NVS9B6_11530 [Candidatus Limnocylindrales bacterium]